MSSNTGYTPGPDELDGDDDGEFWTFDDELALTDETREDLRILDEIHAQDEADRADPTMDGFVPSVRRHLLRQMVNDRGPRHIAALLGPRQ